MSTAILIDLRDKRVQAVLREATKVYRRYDGSSWDNIEPRFITLVATCAGCGVLDTRAVERECSDCGSTLRRFEREDDARLYEALAALK